MLPSFAWKPSMPDFFWNKEGFACEVCRDYETKVFQRRTVISPLYAKNFFDNRIFLTQWMVPPRISSALWVSKIIQQKLVISPSWAEKFFDTRIFLTQGMVPPQKFQHSETKKISTQRSDIPFLRKKFVDSGLCLKHWIVTPRNFSALWDSKKVQRKVLISISYAWNFSIPEVSGNIEEYPTKFSGTVTQTNLRKNGTTPIFYQ